MNTLFLTEQAQLKVWFQLKKNTSVKTMLDHHAQLKKKASVKTLLNDIFYKTNLTDFCVDTLFLNKHAQLKNKTNFKNKTKLKKTSGKALLNDLF